MKPVQSYFLKLALQKSVLPCERILPSNRFSCFPSDSSIAALTNSVTGPMIWNAKYDICLVIRLHLFILFCIVFWKGGAPGIKTGSQNWEQKIFWERFYVSGPNLRYCLLYIPLWGGGIFVTPHPYWTVLNFCLFNIIDVFIFFTKLGEIVECGTTCTPVNKYTWTADTFPWLLYLSPLNNLTCLRKTTYCLAPFRLLILAFCTLHNSGHDPPDYIEIPL